MTDVEADGVGSRKVRRARVSLLCSVRCTGRIGYGKISVLSLMGGQVRD